jgi:hypothetical protein
MHRFVFLAGLCAGLSVVLLPCVPAAALSAKQKMETCKVGADYLKLHGQKRAHFLQRCMVKQGDERGSVRPASGGAPEPRR